MYVAVNLIIILVIGHGSQFLIISGCKNSGFSYSILPPPHSVGNDGCVIFSRPWKRELDCGRDCNNINNCVYFGETSTSCLICVNKTKCLIQPSSSQDFLHVIFMKKLGYDTFTPQNDDYSTKKKFTSCPCDNGYSGQFCEHLNANIAYKMPAAQSSNYISLLLPPITHYASMAVTDKHTWPDCACTNHEAMPWWAVTLDSSRVHTVQLKNRLDSSYRLRNFKVYVSTDAANPNLSSDKQLCGHYPGTVGSSAYVNITCTRPLYGKHVSVQLELPAEYFTLCDVKVFSWI